MQKKERATAKTPVLVVQRLDMRFGAFQQQRVGGQVFGVGVGKIRQQAKAEVVAGVGQKANFQRFAELLAVFGRDQHRRHRDQGARVVGNAARVVHARQALGTHQPGQRPIDDGHRQMAGGNHRQHGKRRQGPQGGAGRMRNPHQHGAGGHRQQDDGGGIARQCNSGGKARQLLGQALPDRRARHQFRLALIDQVIAHVTAARVGIGIGVDFGIGIAIGFGLGFGLVGRRRKLNRQRGHLDLGQR
ncbi:hypothetical protein D3C72_1597040 [compost metagenome]